MQCRRSTAGASAGTRRSRDGPGRSLRRRSLTRCGEVGERVVGRSTGSHRSAPGRPSRSARSPPTRPWTRGRTAHRCGPACRSGGPRRPSSGWRTAIPATCSTVTVFSLSVNAYVGTPPAGAASRPDRPAACPGPVPGRDHHPEPRPRQPRAEQAASPAPPIRAGHHRAPVELQPQPRLGDPRPIRAPMTGPPRRLRLGHRPPGGALVAREPHRRSRSWTMSARTCALRPSTHSSTCQVRIDRSAAAAPAASPAGPGHGATYRRTVFGSTPTARRRVRTAGQIERFQNLHDLPVRLLHSPSGEAARAWSQTSSLNPEGRSFRTDTNSPAVR